MKTEFDITIDSKDMYRFSMHHAYAGSQGILSILIAVLCFSMAARAWERMDFFYTAVYAGFGLVVLSYLPVHLYLRSKQQIKKSEVLQNALHYIVDEEGIHTSQKEAAADLPWDAVYRIVSTGKYVFLYSSRINAYIIPRKQIEQEYKTIRQLASEHLPKYRFKMK